MADRISAMMVQQRTAWLALGMILAWSLGAGSVAGQTPPPSGGFPPPAPPPPHPLRVVISGPKECIVDQPLTLKVQVENISAKPTQKMDLEIGSRVSHSRDTMLTMLSVDSLAPKESRTLTAVLIPNRLGVLQIGSIGQNQLVNVDVKVDPKMTAKDFLPVAAKTGFNGKPRLPQSLAEVPELAFQEPLSKSLRNDEAFLKTARTIDKINHLNKKKTDAFMEELLKHRPDLAGLSFAMGDSCRLRDGHAQQFGLALANLRRAKAGPLPPNVLVPPPPNFQPPSQMNQAPMPVPAPSSQTSGSAADDDPTTPADPAHAGHKLLEEFRKLCEQAEKADDPAAAHVVPARIAALMQVLTVEPPPIRQGLVKYLAGVSHPEATRALARLAIFSEEESVRRAAVSALKTRREKDYNAILLQGLSYPWPAVAKRTSEAIVQLERTDLIPQLLDVLDRPDPRAPQLREIDGKKTTVVRELVRINHHRNCLLCHAPAHTGTPLSSEKAAVMSMLTAPVPLPGQELPTPNVGGGYGNNSIPDILIRIDVTYLRQEFSVKLPVSAADPWPEMQRFDFLVRTREVSEQDARAYRDLLEPKEPGVLSPYHRAALFALRELTGRDTAPTAEAWRKLLAQTKG